MCGLKYQKLKKWPRDKRLLKKKCLLEQSIEKLVTKKKNTKHVRIPSDDRSLSH